MASYDIITNGNPNYSLVGLTPAIAKKVGATGSINNVPSIDSSITACQALAAPQANLSCWEKLDKTLMTQIVPWVPYLWAIGDAHHEHERHAVRVRPVRHHPRVRTHRGQVSERQLNCRSPGRRQGAPESHLDNQMLIYIARRLVWTIVVLLAVLFITFAVFFLLPNGDPALRFAGKSPTDAVRSR